MASQNVINTVTQGTHPAWAAAVRIKSGLSAEQIQKAEAMEVKVLELRAMRAITTTLSP